MVPRMSTDPEHLVHTRGPAASPAFHMRHPFNPRSQVFMTPLSDPAGMTRMGVNLARVPPGKEAFIPHAHTLTEEWVYVLEGQGVLVLGDREHAIGPGDFVGFPTDGTVHHITNPGDQDLVYLQGGERRDGDASRYPTLGKLGIVLGDGTMCFVPESAIEALPYSAWLAPSDDSDPSSTGER
jgi:uncharacterized cupin superfamily protein